MNLASLFEPQFLAMVLAGLGAAAAVLTVALPLLETNDLDKRMKAVALERDRIRVRERERMAKGQQRQSLKVEPKAFLKRFADQFNLSSWLGVESAKEQLVMAGYRGPTAEYAFLFFRLVMPIALFAVTLVYVFFFATLDQPPIVKFGIGLGGAYLGIKLPEIFLRNQITKRQQSIKRAFPDALDLLLICVESGVSIEHAFRKVAGEVGTQSIELAEEFTLTAAEMSYLPDRRSAFENLGKRTGLEGVKAVCTAMVQAERYGTPVGTALRVLAQESRDQRMNEAEKKAAALPPMLTVPMILFFLPVLFVVIMTPALIQVFKWQ